MKSWLVLNSKNMNNFITIQQSTSTYA